MVLNGSCIARRIVLPSIVLYCHDRAWGNRPSIRVAGAVANPPAGHKTRHRNCSGGAFFVSGPWNSVCPSKGRFLFGFSTLQRHVNPAGGVSHDALRYRARAAGSPRPKWIGRRQDRARRASRGQAFRTGWARPRMRLVLACTCSKRMGSDETGRPSEGTMSRRRGVHRA